MSDVPNINLDLYLKSLANFLLEINCAQKMKDETRKGRKQNKKRTH